METTIKSLSKIAFLEAFAIRPAKSFYKFESTDFIEFKFKDKFEWDFENYRNSILTNRK